MAKTREQLNKEIMEEAERIQALEEKEEQLQAQLRELEALEQKQREKLLSTMRRTGDDILTGKIDLTGKRTDRKEAPVVTPPTASRVTAEPSLSAVRERRAKVEKLAELIRYKKVENELKAIQEVINTSNTQLREIDRQYTVAATSIASLYLESTQINVEAKQAEQEAKEHADNVFYIRERSRKISALNREQHARIMAANSAGKLTLPKVPTFEEATGEVKARIAVHQETIRNLVDELQATKINTKISSGLDILFEQSRAAIVKLTADRKMLARNKNAMLDVEKDNLAISGRLTEATIKRSEAITKDGATKLSENLSAEEAKMAYAGILARAPSVTLDSKQQGIVAELKIPALVLSPTVDLSRLIAESMEADKATVTPRTPTSTALTTSALSISPGKPVSPSMPGSSHSPGSGSDDELKVSARRDTPPPVDHSARPSLVTAEHARLHSSGHAQQRALAQAIGTGLPTGDPTVRRTVVT